MYDYPVFKVLSHNDTGAAPGHQGGIVVPAELEDYFPDITAAITTISPTADVAIEVELVVGGMMVGRATSRYQYQTWGGTRSPERRLTSNLGALRNQARADDILLIERALDEPHRMRLTLIRTTDPEYAEVKARVASRRWGVFGPKPVSNRDLIEAEKAVQAAEGSPFTLFDTSRKVTLSAVQRRARAAAFRARLLELYKGQCAISGEPITTPDGARCVDAAHIVPVEAGGADDPRNGILVSKDLHWAFDKGLFYIDDGGKIAIPSQVRHTSKNTILASIAGKQIKAPTNPSLCPHIDAVRWHRDNLAARWT